MHGWPICASGKFLSFCGFAKTSTWSARATTHGRSPTSLGVWTKGQKMIVKAWCLHGEGAGLRSPFVRLVLMRLATGELLALACSSKPNRALAGYRQRWTIETLFANLKAKGFNLEDTHITDTGKLSTLLAVLALTVTLCVKTGVAAARLHPIPIKKHGRRAQSLFALGLGALRKIQASANPAKIIDFLQLLMSPKLPVNQLKSISV
jgi:hypothetical protein